MKIEGNSPSEWRAAGGGALKALASRLPGVAEALGGYDAFRAQQREKALEEFTESVTDRLKSLDERQDLSWLQTKEGTHFAGRVFDAVLDAQMADKRDFFARAFLSGASSVDLSPIEKAKFLDLLRSLSLLALQVLAALHRRFGPIVAQPPGQRSGSTALTLGKVVEEVSSGLSVDAYAIASAVEELRGSGLLSNLLDWRKHADGRMRAGSSYSGDTFAYTEYAARFAAFVLG